MDETAVKSLVSKNIERLMEMQGFDESSLADRIGRGRDVIRRLLSGETRVNAEHVSLLCDAFHVSPARLFEGGHSGFDDGYRAAIGRMQEFLEGIDTGDRKPKRLDPDSLIRHDRNGGEDGAASATP